MGPNTYEAETNAEQVRAFIFTVTTLAAYPKVKSNEEVKRASLPKLDPLHRMLMTQVAGQQFFLSTDTTIDDVFNEAIEKLEDQKTQGKLDPYCEIQKASFFTRFDTLICEIPDAGGYHDSAISMISELTTIPEDELKQRVDALLTQQSFLGSQQCF